MSSDSSVSSDCEEGRRSKEKGKRISRGEIKRKMETKLVRIKMKKKGKG